MDSDFKPGRRPAKSLQNQDTETNDIKTQSLETFETPDTVAAKDDLLAVDEPDDKTSGKPVAGSNKPSLKQRIKDFRLSWPPGKKEWIGSLVIILFCGTLTAFILNRAEPTPVSNANKIVKKKVVAPKPTTVASNLTGLQVDPAINAKAVTGVMVENSVDARPQSGLSDAGVVFEAIAEGGITRFLALFQDTTPADVGPIRSARPYYVQWAQGFDAGYAHVGGSPEALANIKAWGARDLDQFSNSGSYHRITTRAAPHNVYTSIDALNALETSKGYTTSTYTGFIRKVAAPSKAPNAKSVNINISGPTYNTHYDYVAATNTYNRSEGGAPHVDATGSKQISPNVVVAMIIPYSIASDGYHSQYQAIGSGQVFVFQDGVVSTGTWSKADNKSQLTFKDAAGKPLGLNPGQTWITAVSAATNVTYSP